MLKIGLAFGDGPVAFRQSMNRGSIAPIVTGSPRFPMIATGVGATSRIVTSSEV